MDSAITLDKKALARGLFALLRPRQWIKNGFVLAPLIFSGRFLDPASAWNALLAVVLFSAASSAAYIVNDIHDIEHDRRHPIKSNSRPLAAGVVSIPQALLLMGLLYGILVWGYFLFPAVVTVILGYLALNFAYTFVFKHKPVIDIFVIAIGFVMRVLAGTQALALGVSHWMFVTTLCLALYLAAIKRKQELLLSGDEGRKVLKFYTVALVDRYAEMSAVGALIFYSLFVMSARPELIISIPLVIYGLFRYWFVVESFEGGESPTDALLNDWQLALTVLAWVGCSIWVIWPQ